MFGVFNINIPNKDNPISKEAFNHVTKKGLEFLLKGKDKLPLQPNIAFDADHIKIHKVLNFMFIVLENEATPYITDGDVFNMSFPDLENLNYISKVSSGSSGNLTTFRSRFIDDQPVKIVGIGIGYKEIGGTGENDFIFSYAKTDVTLTNSSAQNDLSEFWIATVSYNFNNKQTIDLPALKLNIGGVDYIFEQDRIKYNNNLSLDFKSNYTNLLGVSNWTGPNIESLVSAAPSFQWMVGGRPSITATSFEELVVEDSVIRSLNRTFRATYKNTRPFAIDITGFMVVYGQYVYSYRCEINKYITIPADKTLDITFSLDISAGNITDIDNTYYDKYASPTLTSFSTNSYDVAERNYDKFRLTQYLGTGKELIRTYAATTGDSGSSVNSGWYTDELVRVEGQYIDGSLTKPLWVLLGNTPPSYNFTAPTIGSTDGWVVNNSKVVFKIIAPAGRTTVQFATRDGVWETFNISANTTNYIELGKKYLYEEVVFIRWGSDSVTGIITAYDGRRINSAELVAIEPFIGDIANVGVVAYNNSVAVPANFLYGRDYLDNNATTDYSQITYSQPIIPITATNNYSFLYETFSIASGYFRAIMFNENARWLNPNTMQLEAVPNYIKTVIAPFYTETDPRDKNMYNRKYLFNGMSKLRPDNTTAEIAIPFNGTPRDIVLTLVKNPTETTPNKITGVVLDGTKSVEIYNTETNEILESLSLNPGDKFSIATQEQFFNHINYGIRYIDQYGINQSLGLEYIFSGPTLAIPDSIEDIYYDLPNKTLSFPTPARATRATISRWGYELYSFECIPNGVTTLYSTEAFDVNGTYELVLYNAEGKKTEPYYIFGLNDDEPVKPDSTGPYGYPNWQNPLNGEYATSGGDFPFIRPQEYESGLFKIRINDVDAREVKRITNQYGLIQEVWFEAAGKFLVWTTGYSDTNQSYDVASSTSSVALALTNQTFNKVDVWHEWGLYETLGINRYGSRRYSSWVPYYGKSGNSYQYSEISKGYVRNTLRLLFRINNAYTNIPWEYDSTLTYKSKYARIYIHPGKLKGSYYRTNSSYQNSAASFKPYINGVLAEWDITTDENGVEILLRCFNEHGSFTYNPDTAPDGWVLDDLDESKVGDPEYVDLYYTLEFRYDKYNWNSMVSVEATNIRSSMNDNSTAIRTSGTSAYYSESIFVKFYPYKALTTLLEASGATSSANIGYNFNGNSTWNENSRWSEVYLSINPSGTVDDFFNNTDIIVNGKVATVSRLPINLDYTPQPSTLLSSNQFEKPITNGPTSYATPNLTPSSYEAYVLTTDDVILINDKHPNVFRVLSHNLQNITDNSVIDLVIVRNKELQNYFNYYSWSNTSNISNNGLYYGNLYFNYMYIKFYMNYPKVIKDVTDPVTFDLSKEDLNISHGNPVFLLCNICNEYGESLFGETENDIGELSGILKINDVDFIIKPTQDYIDWWFDEEIETDFEGIEYIIFNTIDENKYIELSSDMSLTYNGFASKEELTFKFANYNNTDSEPIEYLVSNYTNIYDILNGNGLADNNLGLAKIFATRKASAWNYTPTTLSSGQINVTLETITLSPSLDVADPSFVIPDHLSEFMVNYRSNTVNEFYIILRHDILVKYTEETISDLFNIKINDIEPSQINFIRDSEDLEQINSVEFLFEDLDVKLIISTSVSWNLTTITTLNDNYVDPATLLIIKISLAVQSSFDNKSIFSPFSSGDHTIFPISNIYRSPILSVYDDINGPDRHQSIYLGYGAKPKEEITIDPRIGESPYVAYGSKAYIKYFADEHANNGSNGSGNNQEV